LFLNWETLVEWLNSEGMAKDLADQRYCNDVFRQQNAEHIIQVLELWAQTHSAAELEEQGQLMRFPWAKVASTSDLLNGPQLNERGFFAELTEPSTGKRFQAPAAPLKMSASPFPENHSIPRHGEHNREIFCGELGISARELELLTQEGVI
jgi:crotonobetainyl-CoA:carnitine CoA-transferase CaiB-like acyl-CoA transferase